MSGETDISGWKVNTAVVREAVAHVLLENVGYDGKRVSFEQLVTPLNVLAGADGGEDIGQINATKIKDAFKGNTEYFADCSGFAGFNGMLHIRIGHRAKGGGGDRVSDIALFQNMTLAQRGKNDADKNKSKFAKDHSFRTRFTNGIASSVDLGDRLREFMITAKREQYRNSCKSGQRNKRKEREAARKRKRDENDDEELAKQQMNHINSLLALVATKERLIKEIEEKRIKLKEELGQLEQQSKQEREEMRSAINKLRDEYDVDDERMQGTGGSAPAEEPNKPTKKKAEDKDNENTIHYYYANRIGKTDIHSSLIVEDLIKGFMGEEMMEETIVENGTVKRRRTNILKIDYGEGKACWVPASHTILIKNQVDQRTKNNEIITRLKDLFGGEICRWNSKAQRIFTALNTFGYGCSDEGTIGIITGTIATLFKILDINIPATQITNSVPSRTTLARMEVRLAVDCLFGEFFKMKEADVESLGITTDHGHRKGQDHLVKLLSYPVKKDDGSLSVNFLCLNVDSAGHSAIEASYAISKDVTFILDILSKYVGRKVGLTVITGDAGGGAAVHHLHNALQNLETMDEWSKKLSCDMHNLNKAFEVACIDTWGKQGIGHRTPFQMVWLFVKLMKHVKGTFGRKNLYQAWGQTIDFLRKSRKWQTLALANCNTAFNEFMDALNELEDGDEDSIDEAVKRSTEAPTNIQDPVMTRWGTVLAGVGLFADNWVVIYFFAQTLSSSKKSTQYVKTLSSELVALMHNKDTTANSDLNQDEMQSKMPVFHSILFFLDAFNKFFFQGKQFR